TIVPHTRRANYDSRKSAPGQGAVRRRQATRRIAMRIRHIERRRRVDHAVLEAQTLGLERLEQLTHNVSWSRPNEAQSFGLVDLSTAAAAADHRCSSAPPF